MPITGTTAPTQREPPFFRNFDDFDAWMGAPTKKIEGVLPYIPRSPNPNTDSKGRMLVCHDYKGGYGENPFSVAYTWNYWSKCDTFVYFSHNRVAIPPPGWVNAAHRQGAKMLGTLIFEGGSEDDCLRLCIGPPSTTSTPPPLNKAFPLSDYYAKALAEVAYQRGFDGYLLNFEVGLNGPDQARASAAWLTLLQNELEARVGPHAESIWYDSVVTEGYVYYQNRLNAYNLPFFLSSTGIFTNYWWYPFSGSDTNPKNNATYFNSLPAALTGANPTSQPEVSKKQINDIFIGIDVWGRGSYGGAGFGGYQALTHISPLTLNLSAAIFAPGWTWETEEDKAGWTWDQWWAYDHSLWTGIGDEPEPGNPEVDPGMEGPFVPLAKFFPLLGAPDPLNLPLHVTFCPGTGKNWFVNGIKVYSSTTIGWTDLDKQTEVGDLAWPRPAIAWNSTAGSALPHASSSIAMDDAYNGGSSLRLQLFHNLSFVVASAPIWVPIQSLNITPQKTYEASLIYKIESPVTSTGISVTSSVKPLISSSSTITVTPITPTNPPPPISIGWKQLSIRFTASGSSTGPKIQAGIGLVLSTSGSSDLPDLSILVGQINVYGASPDSIAVAPPLMTSANFHYWEGPAPTGLLEWTVGAAVPSGASALTNTDLGRTRPSLPPIIPAMAAISPPGRQAPLSGVEGLLAQTSGSGAELPARYRIPAQVLVPAPGREPARPNQRTIDINATMRTLSSLDALAISGPDDALSAWKLQPSNTWFPKLLYVNVYAIRYNNKTPPTAPPAPTTTYTGGWVGTSGLDGRKLSFVVMGANLPVAQAGQDRVRFWIQGVSGRGEVLSWDRCVYVDVAV